MLGEEGIRGLDSHRHEGGLASHSVWPVGVALPAGRRLGLGAAGLLDRSSSSITLGIQSSGGCGVAAVSLGFRFRRPCSYFDFVT